MAAARRHHYLPQTYLAGFTDTGCKDGTLNVLDVHNRRAFRTAPANVGAKRDFNAIDDEDKPADALESALSQFETPLANALRRIRDNPTFPAPEDLNWALNLLSLVATRNPRQRARRESVQLQKVRIVADLVVSDRRFYEATMRRARKQGHVTGPEISFEEMQQHVRSNKYEFSVPTAAHHVPEFCAQGKVLEQLGRRTWTLLLAEPGSHLIGCDHPVSIIPNKDKSLTSLSFETEDTVVFFPLGSRVALHGALNSGYLPEVWKLSIEDVARANTRMLASCSRQIYCATETFQIVRRGTLRTIDLSTSTVRTQEATS